MKNLEMLLAREEWKEIKAEGEARELGVQIFKEWKNRYSSALCAYMRLWDQASAIGAKFVMKGPSRSWCNAAVLILDSAEIEAQDRFLRGNTAMQGAMVEAVLSDGGIARLDGFFMELPV